MNLFCHYFINFISKIIFEKPLSTCERNFQVAIHLKDYMCAIHNDTIETFAVDGLYIGENSK